MWKQVLGSSLAILACGCAVLDGKQRELNLTEGGGVSFDISRRAILVGGASSEEQRGEGDRQVRTYRVCAEPSPDAMTTLAAGLSASGSLPSGQSGELATALSESGAYIGLRTQSIQLLRDSMFRTCEAYLSGGISDAQYALLLRRHQRYMLALLSIEALTGTVRAPNVTLSTESIASASASITRLREQHADIQSEHATVETQISAKQAEVDAAEDGSDAKARLESELADLHDRLALLDEHKTLIETAIENASGLMASGTTRVEVSNVGIGPARSDAHIESIAQTIDTITRSLLDMDDFSTLCLIHLLESEEANNIVVDTDPFINIETNNTFIDMGNSLVTAITYSNIDQICAHRLNDMNGSISIRYKLVDNYMRARNYNALDAGIIESLLGSESSSNDTNARIRNP